MYQVDISLVKLQIRNLKPLAKNQVLDALDALREDPYHAFEAKRMTGGYSRFYRCKAGEYRVIYDIQEKRVKVIILKIGHRKDVYQD